MYTQLGSVSAVCFSIPRSMPTATAEDSCRSEGISMRVSPRPFRCYPLIQFGPSAFAVGMCRQIVKNRSAAESFAARRRRLREVRRQDTRKLGQARLLRSQGPRDAQPTPGQRRLFFIVPEHAERRTPRTRIDLKVGTSIRVSPRPFRRNLPIRSGPSAFAVGMRRRVVKNRYSTSASRSSARSRSALHSHRARAC